MGRGSPWTPKEFDAIARLRVDGLSTMEIVSTLQAAGMDRTRGAIEKYVVLTNAGRPRPFDPAIAAADLDIGVGKLNARIENVIPPIYQPDAPKPPPVIEVPDGESRVGVIGDTHLPFCLPGRFHRTS